MRRLVRTVEQNEVTSAVVYRTAMKKQPFQYYGIVTTLLQSQRCPYGIHYYSRNVVPMAYEVV